MDQFKQIAAFVAVATRGSLSAAARAEGVTPAMIGRRLDALEERLGVKLMVRTTRRLTLSFEGQAFLEDCQRVLNDLSNAEASVSLGGVRAAGHLRLSAPAGFGRRHVAPLVAAFMEANPEVTVNLDLSDRLVDLVNENIDCAVRVGELTDSSLVGQRLGEMRRMVVASRPHAAQAHRGLGIGQVVQHPLAILKEGLAFEAQGQLAGGTDHQLDAEALLQSVQPPADHGRRHPLCPGGGRQAAPGGHGHEGGDLLELIHSIPEVKDVSTKW